ncbi:FAD-binding oxidoreductase [Leekyejoonella antrihumi]|uniref:FAD-binding oxidoreductase n=1 Tax=Leekyejoonella antrihumi TaxID=1660198 RepID=A0A563E9R1_9MICO|nr:FAD-binding oxidoreductase [Leekyejoonella antrihumi]TWP38941.1 FAD-binding oxidoreductase [Leekyejoonella antrihumi]
MSNDMHWSRWGDLSHGDDLPESAIGLLELAFGDLRPVRSARLTDVQPRPVLLDDAVLDELRSLLGADNVSVDHEVRIRHTRGKSTPDLLAMRAGDVAAAPDAVLSPGTHEEVVALIEIAGHHRIAVVPYGGGTSVVGGLTPDGVGENGVVAIDLSRLDALVEVDVESSTATVEAGVLGPRAEELLAEHGLTLGHFPQSFEYASIGGFAATRSSGQSSSGYGRFDSMVVGLKVATARGTWDLGTAPAGAAGPDLRQLVLGSEGAFGVITQVRVAVRRAPEVKAYETWRFPSFAQGRDALRNLVQDDLNPTVLRLSDEAETTLNLADPDSVGAAGGGGVLMVCGYEGTAGRVHRMRDEVSARLVSLDGVSQGDEAGRRWAAGRFGAPYLRDALMDRGVIVETLETATFWSDIEALYDAVKVALEETLRGTGATPIVLCHISHVYRTGASLYFTVAFDGNEQPAEQWQRAKAAASEAIRRCGATITHHHAVGRDHLHWYAQEIGPIGVRALRAVKAAMDPDGVLNPGVLIP